MSRTFRAARGNATEPLASTRDIREYQRRPYAKAFKKTLHHRARRAVARIITGQLQEGI